MYQYIHKAVYAVCLQLESPEKPILLSIYCYKPKLIDMFLYNYSCVHKPFNLIIVFHHLSLAFTGVFLIKTFTGQITTSKSH